LVAQIGEEEEILLILAEKIHHTGANVILAAQSLHLTAGVWCSPGQTR